jgi:hypothetical protein
MNKSILTIAVSAAFLAAAQPNLAGEVTGLTSFTAGTPAVASQVNGNFTAVKTAVDNNHARITTLESTAASPNITGNITLVPSTATAGNIMKGATRFLHNYGNNNTFLGENAGNFTMTGTFNTASGWNSLHSNTTGYDNTAIGGNSLHSNTTGHDNTASGVTALYSNTIGNYNTASGKEALFSNTTGNSNTASGYGALNGNTTGNSNTASGYVALYNNATGSYNTASGYIALYNNTTGNYNIAIGYGAGQNLTTGNSNIAIGNSGFVAEANTIRIGSADQTRAFIAGIRGVTTATAAIPVLIGTDGQLGTTSSSRRVKDDIADMGEASSALMKLRPVTFHYKADKNPKGRALQYGLIAEEVEKVAPSLVARSADGEIETVFYQHLTPMLLNEYQKQQRTIEAQSAMLTRQTARIAALEKQAAEVAELRQQMARVAAALLRMQQPDRIAAVGRQ